MFGIITPRKSFKWQVPRVYCVMLVQEQLFSVKLMGDSGYWEHGHLGNHTLVYVLLKGLPQCGKFDKNVPFSFA